MFADDVSAAVSQKVREETLGLARLSAESPLGELEVMDLDVSRPK